MQSFLFYLVQKTF